MACAVLLYFKPKTCIQAGHSSIRLIFITSFLLNFIMAKKEKAAPAAAANVKLAALQTAMSKIEKQFGKGSIMRLGDQTRQQIEVIPSGSIKLDAALGVGGYARGRIIEIYGQESSGKTTLALHAIAECQKQGGCAVFIDAEHALDTHYAASLGVDIDSLYLAQPDNGEQAMQIADQVISSGAVDIIVIDSVAALTPKAEIEGEMGENKVGLQARLMSQALRKLTATISKSKTCCIFINQTREKIGVVYGPSETTAGGNALKFYATMRLEGKRGTRLKDGDNEYGYTMRVRIVKNKVSPPFKSCELEIIYGAGISLMGEIIDLAEDFDILKKSGSWYKYNDRMIAQGREKLRAYLEEHPDECRAIEAAVRAALSGANGVADEGGNAAVSSPAPDLDEDFDGELPDVEGIDPDELTF